MISSAHSAPQAHDDHASFTKGKGIYQPISPRMVSKACRSPRSTVVRSLLPAEAEREPNIGCLLGDV